MTPKREHVLPILSLFTSASTLVCCALPALLVSLGFGAVLAGVVTTMPQLVWLSEQKGTVFIVAGILLAVAGVGQWSSRNAPCPLDPVLAKNCQRVRRIANVLFLLSVALYVIGFFFAYLAVYLI